jgi:hypothetical protein
MISLNIGDIEIKIIHNDGKFLRKRFAGFLSNKGGFPTLSLEVHTCNNSLSTSLPALLHIHPEGEKVAIERAGFKGYINLKTLEGEVKLFSENSFESFLRILCSLILPEKDGLSIHASSLIRNGKAYVFPGESEAGKTTIVRLSPEATLLTDEISIIRGIGSIPVAYGTPFRSDLEASGDNVSAPVKGLYFPVKDNENYLYKLNNKPALARLLSNVVIFGQDHNLIQKAFYLAYDLVRSLPCYELHFLPEPSFWNCIDE